ncbi:MAG: 4Fe-4S dicluster domain-containing protein [Candidatus Eiseniibacteriota bacterium]|nr:MAG: 4Fe-4S dicluster domain-containing protein [Candidatus Eisenbacteria bacterium]
MLQLLLSIPAAAVAIFLASFAFSSVAERERRAAFVSAILLAIFLAIWLWAESQWRVGHWTPLLVTSLASLCAALVFFVPFPSRRALQTVPGNGSSVTRVDERDVIFSRADLVEGSPEYEEYYQRRPEFKDVDRSLQSVSEMGVPEQEMYSPLVSPLTSSASRILKRNIELVDGPVSEKRTKLGAETATRLVKLAASRLGAEAVGIAPLAPECVYSHVGRGPEPHGSQIHLSYPWVVCFAVPMDYDVVRGAPSPWNTIETHSCYAQVSRIGVVLAAWLRALGYAARAHVPGSNYQVMLPPLAALSGLGEMGRIGVMVSRSFGPRVRLGAVTTELALVPDAPTRSGIEEFCATCLKCAVNCPAGAIPTSEPQETRGVVKWTISAERCYKYWCKLGNDCGICLRVCPFSKPDTLVHDVIRHSVKASPLGRRVAIAADDLFYGKRPVPMLLPSLKEI